MDFCRNGKICSTAHGAFNQNDIHRFSCLSITSSAYERENYFFDFFYIRFEIEKKVPHSHFAMLVFRYVTHV